MEILVKNAIKCKLCGEVIQSIHVHDFKSCKCGECFVDGGFDYSRRGAKNFDNIIELSEYVKPLNGIFYLKNKDIIVAELNLQGKKIKNFKILKAKLLPKGIKEKTFKKDFESWVANRTSIRAKVNGEWAKYKTNLLLSLNDCYYIAHKSEKRTWNELSLYQNKWDKNLSHLAFHNKAFCIGETAISPEFTTDGALGKTWFREDSSNEIYLLKQQNYRSEQAKAEFLACQVAKAFGIKCVEYDFLGNAFGVCKCKSFCDEKIGLVQIHRLIEEEFKDYYNYALAAKKLFGEKLFNDMIVFDVLILNKDRHYGNFGFLINNKNNKILRPAPMYDNGYCIFRKSDSNEIARYQNMWRYEKNRTFGLSMEAALNIAGEKRHIKMLKKFYNFTFEKTDKIDKDEIRMYEWFLQNHARNMVEILENKK